jgi:hypothetical protein
MPKVFDMAMVDYAINIFARQTSTALEVSEPPGID